eukprot:scaffold5261_cov107-Isochrysis_galbana.AAC.3
MSRTRPVCPFSSGSMYTFCTSCVPSPSRAWCTGHWAIGAEWTHSAALRSVTVRKKAQIENTSRCRYSRP